jgi:hypothetical protein
LPTQVVVHVQNNKTSLQASRKPLKYMQEND